MGKMEVGGYTSRSPAGGRCPHREEGKKIDQATGAPAGSGPRTVWMKPWK
jgi:hypothetical protein